MNERTTKAIIREHLADVVAIARAIKADVSVESAEEINSDLKSLMRRIQVAIDSIN